MEGDILTNELHNLICARYEFHRGKSMTDSYRNFCKIVGDDAMEYKDFDFWWHRFANGEFDLNYDRSKDPPALELLDMPIDIMEQILKKLNYGERSVFRKVSKACRRTVDSFPYTFKKVEFNAHRSSLSLRIDNRYVIYYRKNYFFPDEVEVKADEEPWKRAFEVFNYVFDNPKHQIQELVFYYSRFEETKLITESLKSLGHKLNVNSFKLRMYFKEENGWLGEVQEQSMGILPFLKEGVLEALNFECLPNQWDEHHPNMLFDKIIKTEHWKQAKRLTTNFGLENVKLDDLLRFYRLDVHCNSIKLEDAIRIKEICKNFAGFKKWRFWTFVPYKEVLAKLNPSVIAPKKHAVQDGNLRIYAVSNLLEFKKINQ